MTATLDGALQAAADLHRTHPDPSGVPAIIVGGAVRDALLGRPLREADIAVAGDADAFAHAVAAAVGAHVIRLDPRRGVYRLPIRMGYLDIVRMTGDPPSLPADLARRDFTVNALAFPLAALPPGGITALDRRAVIDQHNGLDDLDARRLRETEPGVIADDPVRILRAVRFAVELGFSVEAATQTTMQAAGPLLPRVAAERVSAELQRIFFAPNASRGVRLMDALGLLTVCFPDLEAGRNVDQRPHHLYPVLEHQMVALEWLDTLLAAEAPAVGPQVSLWRGLWDGAEWEDTPFGDLRLHFRRWGFPLRVATLLHDLGKPATRTQEANGRTRFFGHPERGAEMACHALQRWRFPSHVQDRVGLLIEQHLRPGQVSAPGETPSPRALHRFHKALGNAVPDLCWLFLADSLATVGPQALGPRWPAYVQRVHRITAWQPAPEARSLRRLVDGHAVMLTTGIPPGPLLGRILVAMEEAAAAGDITTQRQALDFATTMAAAEQREEG